MTRALHRFRWSGPLVRGGWGERARRAAAHVSVTTADNAGVQSVAATRVGTSSEAERWRALGRRPNPAHQPAAPTSPRRLRTYPTADASCGYPLSTQPGTASVVPRRVHDNTPPDPVVPEVSGGGAWLRTNSFDVTWTNPSNNAAPIARAHWKLCTIRTDLSGQGHADRPGVHRLPGPSRRLLASTDCMSGSRTAGNQQRRTPWSRSPCASTRASRADVPAHGSGGPAAVAVNASTVTPASPAERSRCAPPVPHMARSRDRPRGLTAGRVCDDERFRNGAYEFRASRRSGWQRGLYRSRADGSAATLGCRHESRPGSLWGCRAPSADGRAMAAKGVRRRSTIDRHVLPDPIEGCGSGASSRIRMDSQ